MPDRPSLDEFLRLRGADRRLARLTHDLALPQSRGLEFGPAADPLPLPDRISVEYVDLPCNASEDRQTGQTIDHRWSGAGVFTAACDVRPPYDFAVASHFAQRVPNLLGWMRNVFDVLTVGGVLNLALPDKRFTGDALRNASTIGGVLDAFAYDLNRASVAQVFDAIHLAISIDPARLWEEDLRLAEQPRKWGEASLAVADQRSRDAAEGGDVVDCHCWVFTPLSFLDLIEGLSRLRLFPFVVSEFSSTDPGGWEFFVCLRRDAEEDPETLVAMQLGAIHHVRAIAERRTRQARLLAGP